MRFKSIVLAFIVALGLVVPTAASAAAAGHHPHDRVVRVFHPPTSPTLVQGSGLGAVRTFFVPISANGKNGDGYYMTGTLTTVTVGLASGDEIRASNLAFVFGSETNQIVVGGISLYAPANATISVGAQTIRPIIGGSGTYNGARGYVVSTNLGAAGWSHVFHVLD